MIPASYLMKDLYTLRWQEPDPIVEPAAAPERHPPGGTFRLALSWIADLRATHGPGPRAARV